MDVVDTDILIDIQRGHPPALAWFGGLTQLPGVPGFVLMELIQDARNAREVRQTLKLVAPLPIVWAHGSRLRASAFRLHRIPLVAWLGLAGLIDCCLRA